MFRTLLLSAFVVAVSAQKWVLNIESLPVWQIFGAMVNLPNLPMCSATPSAQSASIHCRLSVPKLMVPLVWTSNLFCLWFKAEPPTLRLCPQSATGLQAYAVLVPALVTRSLRLWMTSHPVARRTSSYSGSHQTWHQASSAAFKRIILLCESWSAWKSAYLNLLHQFVTRSHQSLSKWKRELHRPDPHELRENSRHP